MSPVWAGFEYHIQSHIHHFKQLLWFSLDIVRIGGRALSDIKLHITWHGNLHFHFFCFFHCKIDMSLTLCQISYCCLPTAHSNCETVSTFHCTDKQTHCFTSLHNCLWPFSRDSHIHQNYVTADAVVCNVTKRMSVSLVHGKFVVILVWYNYRSWSSCLIFKWHYCNNRQ